MFEQWRSKKEREGGKKIWKKKKKKERMKKGWNETKRERKWKGGWKGEILLSLQKGDARSILLRKRANFLLQIKLLAKGSTRRLKRRRGKMRYIKGFHDAVCFSRFNRSSWTCAKKKKEIKKLYREKIIFDQLSWTIFDLTIKSDKI